MKNIYLFFVLQPNYNSQYFLNAIILTNLKRDKVIYDTYIVRVPQFENNSTKNLKL